MKKFALLCSLGLYLCTFFAGCHTLDTLHYVKTGNIDFSDGWEAMKTDDREFQEVFW